MENMDNMASKITRESSTGNGSASYIHTTYNHLDANLMITLTSYKDRHGKQFLFPVELGNDMTANIILGTTVIDQWVLELKFNPR